MFQILLGVVRVRAIRLFVDVSDIGSTVSTAEHLIPCPLSIVLPPLSISTDAPQLPPSGSAAKLHTCTPCSKFQVVLDPLLAPRALLV
jgi:hypothetical protein